MEVATHLVNDVAGSLEPLSLICCERSLIPRRKWNQPVCRMSQLTKEKQRGTAAGGCQRVVRQRAECKTAGLAVPFYISAAQSQAEALGLCEWSPSTAGRTHGSPRWRRSHHGQNLVASKLCVGSASVSVRLLQTLEVKENPHVDTFWHHWAKTEKGIFADHLSNSPTNSCVPATQPRYFMFIFYFQMEVLKQPLVCNQPLGANVNTHSPQEISTLIIFSK